jgi:hypothetical protein
MPRVDSGAGPRVLFKTETTSSQTPFVADAHSRNSEAGEENNRLDAMILACAIIRRSKRPVCHHPKCARPKEFSVAVRAVSLWWSSMLKQRNHRAVAHSSPTAARLSNGLSDRKEPQSHHPNCSQCKIPGFCFATAKTRDRAISKCLCP